MSDVRITRFAMISCPHCGRLLNSAMAPSGSLRPKNGDLSFCVACARLSTFVVSASFIRMRPATGREIEEMFTDNPNAAAVIAEALRMSPRTDQ